MPGRLPGGRILQRKSVFPIWELTRELLMLRRGEKHRVHSQPRVFIPASRTQRWCQAPPGGGTCGSHGQGAGVCVHLGGWGQIVSEPFLVLVLVLVSFVLSLERTLRYKEAVYHCLKFLSCCVKGGREEGLFGITQYKAQVGSGFSWEIRAAGA